MTTVEDPQPRATTATVDPADGAATLRVLAQRRSYGRLQEPAPDTAQLEALLVAAATAPDHDELRPWRFVVLEGAAKDAFGAVLEAAYVARCAAEGTEVVPAKAAKERTKLGRAPLVVVTAVAYQPSAKVPAAEQFAAVAAATGNLCLAASALGFGAMWRTGDAAYDPAVHQALGLAPGDAVVGFVYLGAVPPGREKPPHEPTLTGVARRWSPPSPS